MGTHRFAVLAAAAACAGAVTIVALAAGKMGLQSVASPTANPRADNLMPELDGAVAWLNSKPLNPADLRGKVVLVDFWTYSCINWQRTLPYVRAWTEKYKDKGLVVIGVHTPEFAFEKDIDRIRNANALLKVDYPVAVDSDQAIWRAFDNQYWPALYIVDARGTIRHHKFGEGDYEASERVIQRLLTEAGAKDIDLGLVRVDGAGSQAEADWANLRSPETYLGSDRAENFASTRGMTQGQMRAYVAPERLGPNKWALSGEWTVGGESATLAHASGRIVYRFHARDLHLVMGSASQGKPVPFRVLIDGRPPATAHGSDVDAEGRGVVVEHRLYQLIRQPQPIVDRKFEIEFLEPGAAVYSFTFG